MKKNYDICIIGSGAAGAFLAQQFKMSPLSVLILESGTQKPDFDTTKLIDRIHSPWENSLLYSRSRQIGGTTNIWGGKVTPFQLVDIERGSDEGAWPIKLSELKPYYEAASALMGLPSYEAITNTHTESLSSSLLPWVNEPDIELKTLSWSNPPFNAQKKIWYAIQNNPHSNITLSSACHVTQLIEYSEHKSIRSVEYIDSNKKKQQVTARYIVIAAGGLESARLLLNSTSKSQQGIANDKDTVGRYLSTHPKIHVGTLKLYKNVSINSPLFSNIEDKGHYFRQGIGLSPTLQLQENHLNHYIEIHPLAETFLSTVFQKIKHKKIIPPNLLDFTRKLKKSSKYPFLESQRCHKKTNKFSLQLFLDQYPNPNNRVQKSYSNDPYGYPKIDIDWDLSNRDKRSIQSFLTHIEKPLIQKKIGYIESKYSSIDNWPLTALHSHFMGTTRMGLDAKNSVVDSHCRAHGYDNLFIAGPSVFPTYSFANPMYTIAALSIRLGEHLKRLIQPVI